MHSIMVVQELQMAHRLPNLPGKCQRIHGHTWRVVLEIFGEVDEHGILLDYTEVKLLWRNWLMGTFDHRLALWVMDPLLSRTISPEELYPGHVVLALDPTVENLAEILGKHAIALFGDDGRTVKIELWEGNNNCATWKP